MAEAALDEGGRSAHDHSFRVVGRMPATGTPWDRAVVVPIEALWNMHDAGTGSGRCSVVVVKPVTVADAYRLRGALNGPESQSVFTGEVLTRLFGTMEQMHDVMMLLASGAQAAALGGGAGFGIFRRGHARAGAGASAGARRVARLSAVSVWLMVSGVLLAGSALGLGLGCLMASAASSWIQAETGVALTVTLTAGDALAALAAAGCGCLAAFLPAWFACRRTAGELLRSA